MIPSHLCCLAAESMRGFNKPVDDRRRDVVGTGDTRLEHRSVATPRCMLSIVNSRRSDYTDCFNKVADTILCSNVWETEHEQEGPMGMRRTVAVLFGGRSAEHEVSILSARNVLSALDTTKYDPVLIGIDRDGTWFLNDRSAALLEKTDTDLVRLNQSGTPVSFVSGGDAGSLMRLSGGEARRIDVIFPVLHGPEGEDGSIQGLARLAGIPCVGAGTLGSAVSMDKDVAKRLLRDAGLDVAPYRVVRRDEVDTAVIERIGVDLGYPVFVKPANLGSSVGVSRAGSHGELKTSLTAAFAFDDKVLVERAIVGREIECAVLGNRHPRVSVPGEVVTDDGFYTYEKKYIDENGATLIIPAAVEEGVERRLEQTALAAFGTLEVRGMARIDMFLTPTLDIYVNEVNTIPGFTKNSMYPKLWEASGIGYTELLDRLIALSIEEFQRTRNRKVVR